MKNIIIRKSKKSDIEKGLLEVFIEGYRFHQNGRPDVFDIETDEELKEVLEESFDKCDNLVAIIDEEIVGHLSFQIKSRKSKKLHIDELVIKEKFRKQGVGKALINEAIKIAKENDCKRVEFDCWLFNTNALSVYEHMGFEHQRIAFEMKLK